MRSSLAVEHNKAKHALFQRICVAVDRSDASESAARLAVSMVRNHTRQELTFCHVIDATRMLARAESSAFDFSAALEEAQKEAKILLDRFTALARCAGVASQALVRFGEPSAEVVALAKSIGADLIVIGNTPRHKVLRLLKGSVRDEIVQTATCPVLAADVKRTRSSDFKPRYILVAEADSLLAARAKRFAAELANEYGAELVLQSTNCDAAGTNGLDSAESHSGLIVTGIKRRHFKHLFTADCVERLLQSARQPVLITPVRGAVH